MRMALQAGVQNAGERRRRREKKKEGTIDGETAWERDRERQE